MSQDTLEYFHKDYQRGLVANILRSPDLLQKFHSREILPEDIGSPVHRALLQAAEDILKAQGGFNPQVLIPAITLSIPLKTMIDSGAIFPEELDALKDEFELVYGMDLDPGYYLGTLARYLSETRIKKMIKNYRGGDPHGLIDRAQQTLKSISGPEEENRIISPLMQSQMSAQAVEVVPCGIAAIDNRMDGGLGKKEFGIICGISGLGKTTLAVNFCWGAAIRGKKAALITLELPGQKISERLYSRISGIEYSRIRHGDNGDKTAVNAEVWEAVERIPLIARQKFDIWDYSDEPVSLKTLDNKLDRLAQDGELPDMVFLDWLDALGTDPNERNNGYVPKELRHLLQSYSQGCSDIAKRYNIALWATTQSNAAGDNQKRIGMRNSSEGFSKVWRCSVFLGMGATDKDREEGNVVTVTAGKMRDGQIFSSEIRARLNVQTFEDIDPQRETLEDNPNFRPLNAPAT